MVEEMMLNAAFREELKEMVAEQMLICANDPYSAQALTELLTLRQRFSSADFFIAPGRLCLFLYCGQCSSSGIPS